MKNTAIEIAQKFAHKNCADHAYLPKNHTDEFIPHAWVVDAIEYALRVGNEERVSAFKDGFRRVLHMIAFEKEKLGKGIDVHVRDESEKYKNKLEGGK